MQITGETLTGHSQPLENVLAEERHGFLTSCEVPSCIHTFFPLVKVTKKL